MARSRRKYVWEIGLENLQAAYEKAQIELAREFLGDDPFYVHPSFSIGDEDPELVDLILEADLVDLLLET